MLVLNLDQSCGSRISFQFQVWLQFEVVFFNCSGQRSEVTPRETPSSYNLAFTLPVSQWFSLKGSFWLSERVRGAGNQSIVLGSEFLKESSSSESDVGMSLEGVWRWLGPPLPWHTYHSLRLVTWGERFAERFLCGSGLGERGSPRGLVEDI